MISLVARKPARRDASLPMINVAFLLLIFFLLTAAIASTDATPVTLPEVTRSSDEAENGDGRVTYIGEGVFVDREGAGISPAEFRDQPVQLRIDSARPATDLARAVSELQAAGVLSISILAEQTQ